MWPVLILTLFFSRVHHVKFYKREDQKRLSFSTNTNLSGKNGVVSVLFNYFSLLQNLFAAMSQQDTMTLPRKRGAVVLSKDGMSTVRKETSA